MPNVTSKYVEKEGNMLPPILCHDCHRERGIPIPARPCPHEKYDVIVVDPPWSYGADTGRPNRTAEAHYKTVGNNGREVNRRTGAGIENIVASVPVKEWAADNAHIYVWVTNPKLPFAFALLEEWGFTYKTMLTWVKTTKGGRFIENGMGFFWRGGTEHVLFGVRGKLPIPPAKRRANIILAQRGAHSEKPNAFYELVDTVSPPKARKLDVFARKKREGWSVYGDEVAGLAEHN